MRPAGKSESAKLYGTYPLLQSPPDRASLSNRAPVAILGAGPIQNDSSTGAVKHADVRASGRRFWKNIGLATGRAGTMLL
jgi:hypothetical protein